MVLVDKLVALLIKGHANDSQVETLFNYGAVWQRTAF